jgi:putative DNA primase/helicase
MKYECKRDILQYNKSRDTDLAEFINMYVGIEKNQVKELVKQFNVKIASEFSKQIKSLAYSDSNDENLTMNDIIWKTADAIAEKLNVICMVESRKLFMYQRGIYISNGVELFLENEVAEYADKNYNEKFLQKRIADALHRMEYKNPVLEEEFNKNKNIIVVKNGLVNINTGELRPHTPAEVYTSKFDFNYDPDAKLTPEFENFLKTVFEGVEYQIDIAQEFFGYCLTSEYFIQAFLYMLGGGGNGKGTFLNILRLFIGDENTSALGLHEICGKDKFTLSGLYGKKLNVCGDIPATIIKDTDNLKKTTGRDLIYAQFKYGQPFQFPNSAKIAFAGNKSAVFDDDSKGFVDRLVLIDFPNRFRNTKNDDQDMEKKCTTPESLSGILTWAIAGLKRLREQKKFSHQKSYKEKMEILNQKTNPVEYFVKECVKPLQGHYISNDQLFNYYKLFQNKHNLPDYKQRDFISELKERLYENAIHYESKQRTYEGKVRWCITDISIFLC